MSDNKDHVALLIDREGFSPRGIFVLSLVVFWLLMILAWAFMLLQYSAAWSLLSLPFWAIGLATLVSVIKMLRIRQSIEIKNKGIQIKKGSGKSMAHVELPLSSISSVSLVEGTYKTLAGISRKGIYPAIIADGKAFAIGERCKREEKQWIVDTLKSILG